MKQRVWLRLGLGSVVATSLLAAGVLTACGDDDSGTTPLPDGGDVDVVQPTTDSEAPDSGPTDAPAKITLVHASADLGPDNPSGRVYVCFATAPAGQTDFSVAPLPPLPDTATGLPAGAGGYQPSSTGTLLEGLVIQPYLINGDNLTEITDGGARPTCQQLLGSTGSGGTLTENVGYWKLAQIPAGTLKNNHSYLIAVTGCPQNTVIPDAEEESKAKCGADFDTTGDREAPGLGNLKAAVFELDLGASVGATDTAAQVLHLSPSLPFPAVAPVVSDADGGAVRPLVADGTLAELGASAPTPLHTVTGGFEAGDLLGASALTPVENRFPLSVVSQLSGGTQFTDGRAYVFAFVGEFGRPLMDKDGNIDLKAMHPVAFPTNP